MTVRFPEVIRSGSEVEGSLTGPANPIPSQSIDCGCGQLQCPKLAKFATRRLFVGLICWIGVVQAASYAYFHVTGSTIARRFQIDPYVMDWILVVAELTPILLGLIVAYWGDRVHRASWIGALTLLQSVSYFTLIIPHLTHRVRVIEETQNVTHMSLYADDSPELCTLGLSRIIAEEDDTCYFTMVIIILVLIVSGIANIAYYALGISYLDDNTKTKNVTAFIGVIIAVRIVGILFGYFLGWGCLWIDAENFSIITSYRDQMGAWWLGFPILSILLVIPGLLLSWFPRRLPSEVVEQAAASLLNGASIRNRAPHRTINSKVGSPDFFPSLCRLITNKILMCNILATVFSAMALLNFMAQENIFLESRFYIARPTGMLRGFSDPLPSRLATNIVRPVLIGLIIIISGLVLAKAKPRARYIIGYSFVIVLLILAIIIALIFATCEKPSIIGLEKGFDELWDYCNKDCQCSKDADFRPVCDISGKFTHYNPCYAGCSSIIYVDNVKIYSDCTCVTEWGNDQAKDGPCNSTKCQAGWMFFEFGTLVVYMLIASTFVGDLLVNIRSVFKQDKAISIGFWMMWIAAFVYVLGKILYELIARQTCQYWGNQKKICHLHDSEKLGNYLCYLTILLLSISLLLKVIVWFFCKNLQLYEVETKDQESVELQELFEPAITEQLEALNNNNEMRQVEAVVEEPRAMPETANLQEISPIEEEGTQKSASHKPIILNGMMVPPKYLSNSNPETNRNSQSTIRNLDSEDELDSSSDESKRLSSTQVAYTPLGLDSDVESDLSSVGPRSRKRVPSKDYDETDRPSSKNASLKRRFPNPDHYEDPQKGRNSKVKDPIGYDSSKASSSKFAKESQESNVPKQGDFNEVGIPIVDPFPDKKDNSGSTNAAHLKDVKSLIDRYEQNASQETLDEDRLSVKSTEDTRSRPESKIGIPLIAMVPGRSSSRGQSSSGFGSLPDVQDKNPDSRSEGPGTPSPKNVAKDSKATHQTDL
ncbi:solute carrier organic anion transporter family member 1A5 [Monomorium pharaonis]|uniref:solute carrier organic anion transporter family member 1A5 n=1 Tax=Monomorium pharaonis TaxID=307658 RepID=UPI00063EEC5B|nr:solute carrier organic anion transporter family member 1A5 [Monomorium pharaonis]XP_012523934.1 solute carrier organic anion transporter family member 1A5 [Monomorium pharaonis]XP_012523935.1 solute carrier organic anion transporter family member 1A5 [Monomorium pharaonis]XP_012523936.1 solute carrier organic anion transporter family member 1A5 [Monomorium pharaonis]XP_012523937.1 solute carrier organic anion transporter family member 1A5 [Monomorium pharaonis]